MAELVPARANVLAELEMLDSSQAVEYLSLLIGAPLTPREFNDFTIMHEIKHYLMHDDLAPLQIDASNNINSKIASILGRVLHEVVSSWVTVFVRHDTEQVWRIMLKIPLKKTEFMRFKTAIDGKVYSWQIDKDSAKEAAEWLDTQIIMRELHYLPHDIEALAQKILDGEAAASSSDKPKHTWGWKDGKQPDQKKGDCIGRDLAKALIEWHQKGREKPTASKIAPSLECFTGAVAGGFKYRDADNHSTVKEFTFNALNKRIKKLID